MSSERACPVQGVSGGSQQATSLVGNGTSPQQLSCIENTRFPLQVPNAIPVLSRNFNAELHQVTITQVVRKDLYPVQQE